MNLSDEEVRDRIKSPRNAAAIMLARNQEERLLMHGESILEKYNLPFWAYRNFTLWWESLITQEKHKKIDQLITTPLATVSLVEEIFTAISKFKDAQDRYVSFDFSNPDFTNDYNEYLEKCNDDTFWKENSMEALRTGINDIVVIDCPEKQSSKRPEPYQYLVSPSMFTDLMINKFSGNIEYFIFRQSDFKWDSALSSYAAAPGRPFTFSDGCNMEKCIAIDDTYYRVLIHEKNSSSDWEIVSKVAHNLGYNPCIDFWKPSIKGTNGINKKGILTNLFSKLDKYLFYSALVDYMDIYGAFPIFVTYAMEDEEWDDKRKDVNWGDYYSEQTTSYISNTPEVKNPKTVYTWMGAPGSIMEYPQPADANDANFVKDHPRFINMPVEALKHVNERCQSLKDEIINYATGKDKEYMNEVVKNEYMNNDSFNDQDSIITFVKRQVERVHKFVTKTKAEIRYGKQYFLGITVDYGSDYFLKDAGSIVDEYKNAVEAGMSPEYCQQIAKEASNTRFKNNVDILARQRILKDLIPYQDIAVSELVNLGVREGDLENFILRLNSTKFISQFELEFGDIVKFGKTISYEDKIFLIKKQLQGYVKSIKWKRSGEKVS